MLGWPWGRGSGENTQTSLWPPAAGNPPSRLTALGTTGDSGTQLCVLFSLPGNRVWVSDTQRTPKDSFRVDMTRVRK